MQTHKKLRARILSLALSAAMVTTMMPMNAFAAEGGTASGTSSVGTIQSFDKLEDRFIPSVGENAPDYVYGLPVELNTPEEDLQLPDELTAMVSRTVTAPIEDEPVVDSGKPSTPAEDETIPDEDEVATDDTAADDTVSGNQPASPSDAKEEVKEEIKDEDVPLAPEPEQDEETVTTTIKSESIPVEWNSDKEYKSDENGKFVFAAELPEGYILADGVKLPQIYVFVGKQARTATVNEQFNLPLGETYYFDLSGEVGTITSGKSKLIGKINTALPDTTLHYVPFTYVGTVNAYSLDSSSSGNGNASTSATPSDRSLFVADYNVSDSIGWDKLDAGSFIFGKEFNTNYMLRSLSVGSSHKVGGDDTGDGGNPITNEWDSILGKSSLTNPIKNWSGTFSVGQDTHTDVNNYSDLRAIRGSTSAANWDCFGFKNGGGYAFRPALEVLNPTTLTADGLNAVELDWNGGKFNNSTSSIKIVCAGSTFAAPGSTGLTRPVGNTKTDFSWNTAANGSGTSYEAGASVPNTVTKLYAQWEGGSTTTAVTFSDLTANGTANTADTTELTLTFDKDVTGLTAADITVTGADIGTLTKESGTGVYKLAISNITVAEGGNIKVEVAKTGFTFTPSSRYVVVHKAAVPTAVTFSTLTANGVANTTDTTELTLTFDKDVANLAVADITVTGAGIGTLTKETGTGVYKLTISNITVAEGANVTVTVAKTGFTFTPANKDVEVHKAAEAETTVSSATDLATALTNSIDGTIIKLGADITGVDSSTYLLLSGNNKTVTLDLDGYILSGVSQSESLRDKQGVLNIESNSSANMIVKNSGSAGGIVSTGEQSAALAHYGTGTITISCTISGKFTALQNSGAGIINIENGAVIEVTGTSGQAMNIFAGTVNIKAGATVQATAEGNAMAISSTKGSGIINVSGGTVTSKCSKNVSQGTIILFLSGTLNVTGGTVSNTHSTEGYSVCIFGAPTYNKTGGTVGLVYPETVTSVAFSTLEANGTANTTDTTELTLTFDKDVTGLTADGITVTGATKGTLTKETGTGIYKLTISAITVAEGGNVNVAVAKTGFTFTPANKDVAVHKAPDEIIAQRTKALDFTATSIEKQADTSSWGNPTTTDIDALATEGWKWEYQTLKLTLNGLNAMIEGDVGETFAYLTLPAGATIVLADESINTIDGTVVVTGSQKMAMGIRSGGTITVIGNGSLSVTAPECHATSTVANSYGLNSVALIIGGNGSNPTVTCIGGKATATIADSLARSLGIFSVVDVNGGTLTAKAGTAVGPITEMTGIAINPMADSNYIKVTAGSLLAQGATRAVALSYKKEFDPAMHIAKGDTADDVNDPTGNATWSGALSRSYTFMINGDVAKSVKITVAASSSTITPTTATFDKYTSATGYADVVVTQTLNGNTLTAIKNGATTLTANTNYTVSGNTITIKKEYLATQAVGTTTLTFDYSAGTDPTLAITVSDSTPGSADKTALTNAIADANALKVTVIVSDGAASSVTSGTKFVTTAEMKALTDAITAAQTVANNPAGTAAQVSAAITALNHAVTTFNAAIKTGTYTSSGGGGSSSSQTIYTSVPPKYTGGTKIIGNVRVPDYTVEGAWKKNANGTWNFSGKDGKAYANSWAPVFNPYADVTKGQSAFDWFKFDANGIMITGWHTDADGNTYYLNPTSDNTLGAMQTGWVLIDGKYYYFNEMSDGTRGKLFQNTRTPDGYLVDENGVWDGIKKQ